MSQAETTRKIANLVATAFLYTNSLTLTDRFAEAKSEGLLDQAVAEIYRTVVWGISQGDIKVEQDKITVLNKYVIEGELPTERDLAEFLDNYSYYEVTKASAIAMAIANEQKLAQQSTVS